MGSEKEYFMAKNPPKGDGHRKGAVKGRSQTKTPAGNYVKRDSKSGRFMDVKTSGKTPFKGVRKEKTAEGTNGTGPKISTTKKK